MRILHVVVDRFVISVHLPVRWYGNIIPTLGVEALLKEIERTL